MTAVAAVIVVAFAVVAAAAIAGGVLVLMRLDNRRWARRQRNRVVDPRLGRRR